MIRKVLWIFCLAVLLLFFAAERLVGIFAEPRLEKLLTGLFDMPVQIEGLRVNFLSGRVRASRLTFINQPAFASGPHLDVQGLKFDIDWWALKSQRVRIGTLFLNQPFYFIDRILTPEGPRNNVRTWVRHIKELYRKHKAAATKPNASGASGWKVDIHRIQIRDGIFIFHDHSAANGSEKKFVFKQLDGYLAGFKWPTSDPSFLSQEVKMRGTFGENDSAPFRIEGFGNFATSRISFDLKGEIREGEVVGHRNLWEGLPIEILGGKYQLRSHVVCLERELDSYNELILKSMKVKAGNGATDKIWGYPLKAWIGFLQERETVRLKIPLRGDIADPQFKFYYAFRKRFQDALKHRTLSGIHLLTHGAEKLVIQTQKLAVQTPQAVLETPTKLVDSLEKLASKGKDQNGSQQESVKEEVS